MIKSNQRRQSLRKIAILIQTLEESQSDRLLEQMSLEQAADVRELAETLDDVSDEERATVLEEFLRATGRSAPTSSKSNGVELELSGAARSSQASAKAASPQRVENIYPIPGSMNALGSTRSDQVATESASPPSSHENQRPLGFIQASHAPALAKWILLERESVGVVVLSLLVPTVAARVLEELPFERQKLLLGRLAELRRVEPEVVEELQRVLRLVVADLPAHDDVATGHAAVRAILDQVQAAHRARLMPEPPAFPAASAARGQVASSSPSIAYPSPLAARSGSSMAMPAPNNSNPKRMEVPGQPHLKLVTGATQAPTNTQPQAAPQRTAMSLQEQKAIAARFEDFHSWSEAELLKLLKQVPPRMIKLALIGTSAALINKVLKPLGREEAARWRELIERPGAVRVADIAAAQLAILRTAESMMKQEMHSR